MARTDRSTEKQAFRRFARFVLAASAGLVMAAVLLDCATAPATPKAVPGEQTAFVVPGVVLDAQTTSFQGNFGYTITIENIATGSLHGVNINYNTANGYTYVRGLPEGQYVVRDYVPYGFKNNQKRNLNAEKYLTLEKGKLAVFPLKFIIVVYNPVSADFTASVAADYFEINEKEEARILAFINEGGYVAGSDVQITPVVVPTFDAVDWLKHFNFTAGTSGPFWSTMNANLYSIGLVDSTNGRVFPFSHDASQDAAFPVSLYASLRVPVFYSDAVVGGVSFDFNLVPGVTLYSGTLGIYGGYAVKPFTFFGEAGVALTIVSTYVGSLSDNATFNGQPYSGGTPLFVTGVSKPSAVLGAGAQWQINDWLYLRLKYQYRFDTAISSYQYRMGGFAATASSSLQPLTWPGHSVTFGVGIGLN